MGFLKNIKNFLSPDDEEKKPAGKSSQASASKGRRMAVGKTIVNVPHTSASKTNAAKSGTLPKKTGNKPEKPAVKSGKGETKQNTAANTGRRVAAGKTTTKLLTPTAKEMPKGSLLGDAWQRRKDEVSRKNREQVMERKAREQVQAQERRQDLANTVPPKKTALQIWELDQQRKRETEQRMTALYDDAKQLEANLKALQEKYERVPHLFTEEDLNHYKDTLGKYENTLKKYNRLFEAEEAKKEQRKKEDEIVQNRNNIGRRVAAGKTYTRVLTPAEQETAKKAEELYHKRLREQLPKTAFAMFEGGTAAAQDTIANAGLLGEHAMWALSPEAQQDEVSRRDHAHQVERWKAEIADGRKKLEHAFELTEDDALGQFLTKMNYAFVQQGVASLAGGAISKAGGSVLRAGGARATAAGAAAMEKIGSTAAQRAAMAANLSGKALQNAARYLERNAGLATMATLAGATNYQVAREGGADNAHAMAYGILTGAAEAATEKLFGGNPLMDHSAGVVNKLLYKMLGDQKFLKALDSMPVQVFNEGFEEVIVNYLYSAAQGVTGQEVRLPTAAENAESFALGAALGGVGQAGMLAGRAVENMAEEKRIGQELQRMGADEELLKMGEMLPGTQAETMAAELRGKGRLPTARELARQYKANAEGRLLLTARQEEQLVQAQKMAEQVGARFVLDQSIRGGTANGYYQDGVIHVAADAQNAAMVVFKHELTHHLQQTAPQEYNAFKAAAVEVAGESVVQETMRKYALQGVPLSVEEAMDEVAADFTEKLLVDETAIEGLIRKNPTLADRFFQALRDFLKRITGRTDPKLRNAEQLWTKAYKAAEGKKNTAEENGGVKYSIKTTDNGKQVAVVDDDILSNIDTTNWTRDKKAQAKQTAKEALFKFKDGVYINDISYKVNRTSRREYTRSKDTEILYHRKADIFADKMRAASAAQDVLEATDLWKSDGGLVHSRNDKFIDFVHGTVLIQAGENQYEAETVVGITDRGDHVFYDVVDMKPTTFKIKEESPTTASSITAMGDIQGDPSVNNIANLGLDVNSQGTISANGDGRQLLTARQEEQLVQAQKMAEQEKKRYSINERFRNDVMEWHREGEPLGERFILGDTGPVLQGLGAIESDIYMNGDKISKIMHDHPEITIREIQRIPEILEDPVLILKSRNVGRGEKGNTRMVLFGSVKAQSGRPVLCVLDLRPREHRLVLDDMQKVTSAYTKDNKPVEFVENSDVLYADKKRTTRLLSAIGFQMPMACNRSGYIGSIAYARDNVKLKGVPFSSVVKPGANSQKKFSLKEDWWKQAQLDVIQKSNPVEDDYHTWIRSTDDIHTFREALNDPEWADYDEFDPDYTKAMAEQALRDGEIEVFSSYPIKAGVFVTPSRMEAESYAGRGKIYSKTVKPDDVAWIDPTQGQFAPVENTNAGKEKNLQGWNVNDRIGAVKYALKDMTEDETAALLQYKSSASYKVNVKLRDGLPLTATEEKMVADLDSALEKLPKVKGTVYRTLNFDAVFDPEEAFNTFMAQHFVGGFVTYNAYTSTSTKVDGYPLSDGAKHGVTLEILSQNARDLVGFGNNFESEVLFLRGTDFIIQTVTTDKNGHMHIVMEEVPVNAEGNEPNYDTKKRSMAMRGVQKPYPIHSDLQGVSEWNTDGDKIRKNNLQETGEEVKFSLKEGGSELKHLRNERKEVRDQIGNLEWLEERNNGLSDADAAELRGLREQERMLNEKIEKAREAAKETELPEAERIRAAAEHAAEEVKPTEANKSFRAALLDTFHVQAGRRKDLGNQIDRVAQQILEKGYVTASDEAELCRALYNAGVVVDTSASESYAGIRKDLRKAKIYVDDTVRAELGDDWKAMRQRAFANGIILTTDSNTGQGIDQLHADLADYYPGMFDAQSTDRTAMLEEMISAAEMGKPEHISLMEAAMREGGTDAVESQMAFFDRYLSNELQKFSDQAGFEMRIRADSIRKNAKLKALIVEAETRKQMQKYTKETQDKTIRMVKWLRKKMKYADANLHQVLEEMDPQERETVEQLIETLSTEAKHLTEYRAAQFAENAAFYENMMQNNPDYIPSKQTLDTIAKMDAVYIKDNFTTEQLYAVYQTLREAQHQLVNLEKTLAQENAKKFSELYEQGKSEIDRAKGKLYLSEADMAALPMGKSTAERLKSWATLQQMTPVNVFSMMGGWKKESVMTEMADAFVRGEQKMQAYQNGAEALLADFIKKNEKWIETADGQGKKGEWIKYEVPKIMEWGAGNTPITSDETVTFWMTPAQRAYLYLESRNSDNMRHIAYGGHTFPDKALYTAGKKKQAMSSGVTVKLSPSMVESICKDMTPQEKELAHIIGDLYFDAYSKKAYNKTTQLLYGHDGAIGTHYAQIISNRNYLSQEPTKIDGSIGSVGFNHERVVSKTPTIAASIFDVFEAHSADMAKFVGMAAPVRDMSILMNYTEVGKSGSMRDTITRKWGDGGVEYIDNLMKNLQFREPERMSLLDAVVNKGWNNYVSAIFAANPGIVLKQMSSYPMAGAILGFDTMPKTAMLKSAYRKYRPIINRYSQLLQEREKGYSTRELAEMRRNPGKFQQWVNRDHAGSSSKIRRAEGKAKKFLLGGGAIQWMDCHAVSAIWPWAENYVKKHEPNLEPGTEEFYTRVAKVWEDTVYNTQAVYDEMHRAEVLKSSGAIQKSLTMFHSDMIQQQNILRKKIAEYRADPSMENKKGVQRTVQGVVMSAAFYVALNFLGKLMSGRNDDYRDKDGELTPMSIAEGALWDFAVSTAGLMPGVDAMLEAVEHKVHGNSWGTAAFDVPSVDAINDLLKDTTNLLETGWIMAEGGGESTTENAKAFAKAIRKMAYTAATLLGVPVKNTEKYLMSVINVVAPELSVRYNSLFGDIGKDALEGKHGRVLRANLKILTRDNMGLPSARVEMELERLYQTEAGADILPNAAAPDSVKLPLVDQQGKAILNEDGEVQKEEIMLRAGDKEKYRKAYKNFVTTELHKMVGSAEYKNLTDEEKSRAIEMLYQYAADQVKGAAVDGYKTESSWKANAAAAIKDGATVAQVLAYKAATATMTGEPDGKGGTVAGSLGAKKTDWLQESGWNEKAQAAIYFNMQSETARKKLAEMQKAGVDQSTYYRYLMGTEDITSDYDENGNTIHGSKNKKLYAYLNQMHLTEEQKVSIYLTEIKDFREDPNYKKAAAAGVTDWQYASFATNTGAMTTEKKHGKTVVSRRDKVLGYIDQMPISYEAKDALYYDAGYKESTIHDAPWHGGTIRSSSSGGSSGNRSRGRAGTGSSKRKGPSKADQKKAQKDAAREAAMNSPAVQAYLNRGKQYANGQQMNIYFGNRMLPRAGERVQKGRLPTAREIEEVRNYIKKYGNGIDIEVMEKYLNRFEG